MSKQKQCRIPIGFTLVELLVVIAIISVLIGLLLPAVQKVREAANRVKCQNNLKQLALAAINYHDEYGAFPFSATWWWGVGTSPYYTTPTTVLLPFLEQQGLYQQFYDLALSDGSNVLGINSSLFASPTSLGAITPSVLICPSDSGIPATPVQVNGAYYGPVSYVPNGGAGPQQFVQQNTDAVFPLGRDGIVNLVQTTIVGIVDGTSNTIMFGERSNYDPNWNNVIMNSVSFWGPVPLYIILGDWLAQLGLTAFSGEIVGLGAYPLNYLFNSSLSGSDSMDRSWCFGSCHPGGANFVFCDGSVHFISNSINNSSVMPTAAPAGTTTLLGTLCTKNGGEVVNASQY